MYLEYYNKNYHDIYTFQSGSIQLDLSNPPGPNSSLGPPTGYNQNSILISQKQLFGFPDIDWSGLHARNREIIQYGWPNNGATNQFVGFYSSGAYLGDVGKTVTLECLTSGCPSGDFSLANNYNAWNNGAFAGVLISPEHVITCRHYSVGTASAALVNFQVTWRFLGKNNQIYTKTSNLRAFSERGRPGNLGADGAVCLPPANDGYFRIPSVVNGDDFAIYKLDEPLTQEEQQQIKIYPIARRGSLPPETKIFVQDPNGKFYILIVYYHQYSASVSDVIIDGGCALREVPEPYIENAKNFAKEICIFYNSSMSGLLTGEQEQYLTKWPFIAVGDSGSPMLVNINGETCFYGLLFGGDSFSPGYQFEWLKDFIKNDTVNSYNLRLLDGGYRPPEPSASSATGSSILSKKPYYSLNYPENTIFHGVQTSTVANYTLNTVQEIQIKQRTNTIRHIYEKFGNSLLSTTQQDVKSLGGLHDSFYSTTDLKKSVLEKGSVTPFTNSQIGKNTQNQIVIQSGLYYIKGKSNLSFNNTFNLLAYNHASNSLITSVDHLFWTNINQSYTITPEKNKYYYIKPITDIRGKVKEDLFFNEDQSCLFTFVTSKISNYIEKADIPPAGQTLEGPVIFYTDNNNISYRADGSII